MYIDRVSRRDFENKLSGSVVVSRYLRHPSGIRIGILDEWVSSTKAMVRFWDYKKGRLGDRRSSISLSTLEIPIPEMEYYFNGNTGAPVYPKTHTFQRNRWSYGLLWGRLTRVLTHHQILQLYKVYPYDQHERNEENPMYIRSPQEAVVGEEVILKGGIVR